MVLAESFNLNQWVQKHTVIISFADSSRFLVHILYFLIHGKSFLLNDIPLEILILKYVVVLRLHKLKEKLEREKAQYFLDIPYKQVIQKKCKTKRQNSERKITGIK